MKNFYNSTELNAEYLLIPGGEYTFSVTKEKTAVPPLYFAKYPVTNKLYRRFIDYLDRKSKDETLLPAQAGLRLSPKEFAQSMLEKADKIEGFTKYLESKDPAQWAKKLRSNYNDDKRFNGDDQPVVGVSWFAAVAYCHWLTEMQNSKSKKQNEKLLFRLPTEEQWEWAASGGKRKYPWGAPEPDDSRANYGSRVGQTTHVGAYPAGATPEGLMDMAGNVWEWMENLAGNKDYPDARCLRGGSWISIPLLLRLRCASRTGFPPGSYWGPFIGFRVVCLPS